MLLGKGRVAREPFRQNARLPLGVAQGPGGVLEKGEGQPLGHQAQGKIELGPRHIDFGKHLQRGQAQAS